MILFLFLLSLIPPLLILIYPLISYLRYLYFQKPILKSEQFLIPVSIIIACYNEEKYIQDKIDSFLADDEWIEGSELILVSAGSTDNTNTILLENGKNKNVKVIISEHQISKIIAVNMGVEKAQNDILVFSDCRQKMKRLSVKELVYNFNDPEVGTVVSVLKDSENIQEQSFLRNAINSIVYMDSQSGSGLNVYGALYAQRKKYFRKFPEDQLFDDLFVIASTLSQRKRLVQEPQAVIYDIKFQTYYKGERLERLTRGLLLFLKGQGRILFKIKFLDLIRFLIFKFSKLLLPFSAIIWIGLSLYYFFIFRELGMIAITCFLLLFLFPKSRKLICFFTRVNYYFFKAIFKFFILNKQSVLWEKLKQ